MEVSLSKEQLQFITETVANILMDAKAKEEQKERAERKDKRLYNTQLLLEKYRWLAAYCNKAVYKASQIEADSFTFGELARMMNPGKNEIAVESIQERAVKTKIIVEHVGRMLDFYKEDCERSKKQEIIRKWQTIDGLYLDDTRATVFDIACLFDVDVSTVYKYKKAAIQDLSILFFGFIE